MKIYNVHHQVHQNDSFKLRKKKKKKKLKITKLEKKR